MMNESHSMKFKPPPKRKKVDDPSFAGAGASSSGLVLNLPSQKDMGKPMPMVQPTNVVVFSQRTHHLRNNAVAQAHQDGCTANFRIFDSAYGNFLVPVIPTRSELGGGAG